jgi:AraC-like DNA-binding protein
MPDPTKDVLIDPVRLGLWNRLREVCTQGIRSYHQLAPAEGLDLPALPPAHQHAVPTLVLCLSGLVRVTAKQPLDLLPGDLLLVEPGTWHDHPRHKPGTTSFGLGFLAGRCDVLFFDHQQTLWGTVPEQPYLNLVTALLDETREAERLRLIDEMLAQLAQERIDFVDWRRPEVLTMAAWLWNHLHEPFDVDEMVERAGIGRTAGFRMFKDFFGRSPKQELLSSRIAIAKHLLHRGMSVTEAAKRSGFATRAELTRAFRRKVGHPPSQEVD